MIMNKAQDIRNDYRFKSDFDKGTKIERKVMIALTTWWRVKGAECNYEKIGEDVFGWRHDEPDFYFEKEGKMHTLEVKFSFTDNFKNEIIAIRPSVIYKMKNDSEKYPNGLVLVATPYRFSIIKISELSHCEPYEPWGDKTCFQVPEMLQKWYEWVTPIDV